MAFAPEAGRTQSVLFYRVECGGAGAIILTAQEAHQEGVERARGFTALVAAAGVSTAKLNDNDG